MRYSSSPVRSMHTSSKSRLITLGHVSQQMCLGIGRFTAHLHQLWTKDVASQLLAHDPGISAFRLKVADRANIVEWTAASWIILSRDRTRSGFHSCTAAANRFQRAHGRAPRIVVCTWLASAVRWTCGILRTTDNETHLSLKYSVPLTQTWGRSHWWLGSANWRCPNCLYQHHQAVIENLTSTAASTSQGT